MSIGKIGEFNIHTDNWNLYVERIEQYFVVNKIDSALQVSTLITVIGAECYELLVSLCTPDKPKTKTFNQLVTVLAEHLQPKPSILAERFKFRNRKQNSGEAIKDYVAVLKKMSATCEFDATLHENLRDQFACGISSELIRQRLFSEDNLNFQRAFNLAISLEAAEKDAAAVIGGRAGVVETNSVQAECQAIRPSASRGAAGGAGPGQLRRARRGPWPALRGGGGGGGSSAMAENIRQYQKCRACGASHSTSTCSFTRYVCRVCNKIGHLQRVCPNLSQQHNVEVTDYSAWTENEDYSSDEVIVDINNVNVNYYPPIQVTLNINGVDVSMECDTGSAVSCISYNLYQKLLNNVEMKPSNLILRYYTGEMVRPVGVVRPLVKYKDVEKKLELFVINDGKTVLLGRQWLLELNIQVQSNKYNCVNNVTSEFDFADFSSRYSEVFADGLGRFTGGAVGIHLREGARPVFLRARPLAYALREPVERALEQLVRDGILTPVDRSEWATPIVPVVKKDGSIRICADFKLTLNKVLVVDRYPLPKVEDLLARLHGGKRFSKIDLSQAYAQFELDDSSEYTVINTHKGLFKFNRLVYGLSSSPAIFQKKLEQIFTDLPYVGVFLDDIIISGRNTDEHMDNLHKVFSRLKSYGLRVRKGKCAFFEKSVNYLGHVISEKGVQTCPDKVRAIERTPAPTTVSELRAFIGMVMYYGKFIKNVSSVLAPLYQLLRSGVKFVWEAECQAAFENIKRMLGSSEVLMHYAPELPLVLTADASGVGVGAVISQLTQAGERPVAYASRTLSRAERGYAQIDREALAIVFGIRRFHQYLYGRHFLLRTDHKPLTYIFGSKVGIPVMAASRIQRWAILLSGYNYEIEYIPSAKNCADAMSRLPQTGSGYDQADSIEEVTYLNFVENFLPVTHQDVRVETRKDLVLSRVLAHTQSGWPTLCPSDDLKPYFSRRNELYVDRDCLMWGYRIVVPVALQQKVLKQLHTAHMGIVKTKGLARSYVWWPSIDSDVEATCRACETCAAEAPAPPRAPPQPWPYVPQPWTRLHIDFLGPYEGKTYFVLIDASSKWLEVVEMARTTASAVIKVLRSIFARFGLPLEVISDQGPPFSSAEFHSFLVGNGILQSFSPTYHPASNGAAENAVKLCKRAIKKAVRENVDVDTALHSYLLAYRNSNHSTTGESPAMLLQRRHLRSRLDLLRSEVSRERHVHDAQQRQVQASGGISRSFLEGDTVWARNYRGKNKWVPGKVIQIEGTRRYVVEEGNGQLVSKHIDQIRRRSKRSSLAYPLEGAVTSGEGEDGVAQVGEEMTVAGHSGTAAKTNSSPMQKAGDSPGWATPTSSVAGESSTRKPTIVPQTSALTPQHCAPSGEPSKVIRERPRRTIRPPCRLGFDEA